MNSTIPAPLISVIILNYNGARWIARCLESLKSQTIFPQLEVIVADNLSTDGSDKLAEELIRPWKNGLFIQHGENLGFCEGNNRAARFAKGDFLFFLNNDTWLEPDCLEKLFDGLRKAGAQGAMPCVLDYDSDSFQTLGAAGFDIFGFLSPAGHEENVIELFALSGCCLLIERHAFKKLDGFDPAFFMYAEEYDLCWRFWAFGHRAVGVPAARMHHRMAANVNPKGGSQMIESRTSDTKRFYANRNNLTVLLKNAGGLLLAMIPIQVFYLICEGAVSAILFRSLTHFRRAYLDSLRDCWRNRERIFACRKSLRVQQTRSSFYFLRFLRLRLNRWEDVKRAMRIGLPKRTED